MRFIQKTTKIERTPFVRKPFKRKLKRKLIFGSSGLYSNNQQTVEGFLFHKLRVKIKKNIRRKKKQHRVHNARFAYWVRYTPNTYYTKKSKNARMGSGKGKFVRKSFTLQANQSFVEFRFFQLHWFNTFRRFFYSKFGLLFLPICGKNLKKVYTRFF